jgi:hypothetical protein
MSRCMDNFRPFYVIVQLPELFDLMWELKLLDWDEIDSRYLVLKLQCTKHKVDISSRPSLLCLEACQIFLRKKVDISSKISNLNF